MTLFEFSSRGPIDMAIDRSRAREPRRAAAQRDCELGNDLKLIVCNERDAFVIIQVRSRDKSADRGSGSAIAGAGREEAVRCGVDVTICALVCYCSEVFMSRFSESETQEDWFSSPRLELGVRQLHLVGGARLQDALQTQTGLQKHVEIRIDATMILHNASARTHKQTVAKRTGTDSVSDGHARDPAHLRGPPTRSALGRPSCRVCCVRGMCC